MTSSLRPFRPIKPGEILQEELDERGWTQTDLAEILDRPIQAINEIITGKKAITPETALAFAQAFGNSPEYWLNLESAYRLDLLHNEMNNGGEIARRARMYTIAPVKELIKRKWIDVDDPDDLNKLEHELCRFFEIPSLDAEPSMPFAARKTKHAEPHTPSQIAWAYRVKHIAEKLRVSNFSQQGIEVLSQRLPKLSRNEEKTRNLPKILGDVGVRFVIVEPLPNTQIDGATLWLDGKSPVIAVSLRYDRVDCFWFTLMHEIAHIVLGHARDVAWLDKSLVGKDAEPAVSKSGPEQKADRTAGDWLLPRRQLEDFINQKRPYFSRSSVLAFANQVGIHPAIVVGRLQHRGEIPWSNLRNLLGRIRPLLSPTSADRQ